MTLPPARHEQFATLRGSTGECIPDCQGCEIDRLRAELAEMTDRAKGAEHNEGMVIADWKASEDRLVELEKRLAVAVDALEEIIRVEGYKNTAQIAREALDRIGGRSD